MARRPSSIDRLPKQLRELIGSLREDGCSIDTILEKLNELKAGVSRSALGRHIKTLEEVGERMRRSRAMAEALTAKFGDQPDNQVARLNFELMHGVVFEILTSGGGEDEEGEAITLEPQQAKFLSGALKDLASAQKLDADRVLKIQEDARRKAAAAAGSTARSLGMSAEKVREIERAVLGVE